MTDLNQEVTKDVGLVTAFIKNHPKLSVLIAVVVANLIGVVFHL